MTDEEKNCPETAVYRCTVCRNTTEIKKDAEYPACSRCGSTIWAFARKS